MTSDQIENNYPKAIFATSLIMVVLAAACYFIVFRNPPQQVDGVGGLLVNYGTTDEGSGNDQLSMEEASAAEKANQKAPDKVTPTPPTEQPTPVDNSNQKVVTQDNEDAPVVAANSKKPSTAVATAPAKPAPPKQVVNQNALYKGKANPGTGAGDGTTNTPGNQGSPNGSTLSDNYGPGGSGEGLHMNNWSAENVPTPKNIRRVPGKVIIDFTIDDSGTVLEAHADKKTTADLSLIQSCVDAIKATKFVSKTQVSGNQRGQYTFIFRVD